MNARAGIVKTWTARCLTCVAALSLALCAAPLLAQNINARTEITLQQAVQIATERNPGRVVRAESTTDNGRVIHVIRILGADNVVRTVRIDAQTGEPR